MSYRECKNVLGELVAAGKLTAEQAKNIVEQVAERGEKAKGRGEDGAKVTQEEAVKLAQEEIRKVMIRQRQIVLERVADLQFESSVPNFKNDAEAFQALLVPSLRVREGGKSNSIASLQRARSSAAIADLESALQAKGVHEIVKNKLLMREVAMELGGWSKREASESKAPISGNEQALEVATIFRDAQRKMMFEKNRYGADIRTLDDYITRQTHAADKLQKAGYEKWRADVDPLIDKERIAKGGDLESTLRGIYDGAASGVHLTNRVELDSGDTIPFIKRKGLAHGMSQERLFHLKDGEAWVAYNDLYGRSDLYDTVVRSLEHDGRASVMLQKTGPRGGSWLEAKRDQLIARNQGNLEVQEKLRSDKMTSRIRQIDGSAQLIKSHSIAKAYANIKILNSLHDLGSSLFASFADLTNGARQLQQAGVDRNLMQLHFDQIQNMFRRSGAGPDRAIARMSGVASESFVGNIFSRFWSGDALDGKMSRYASRGMEMTLLPKWTAEGKQGVAEMLSNFLGHEAHNPFEKLNDQLQASFKEYGITPEHWEAMREHVWGRQEGGDPEYIGARGSENYTGNKFITADSVDRIPEQTIRGFLEKEGKTISDSNIARTRDDLRLKFDNYMVDNVNRSFIDQSATGKAFRQGSLLRGTHYGEAVGLFWQYKSFAVEYIIQALGRETYGQGVEASLTKEPLQFAKQYGTIALNQIKQGKVPPLVKLMAGSTLMGAFALVASNFSKGLKTDFSDPRTIEAAFLKGGGLGMYGDFMFANYDTSGNNFLTKFGGPSATRLVDAVALMSELKSLDSKSGAQAEKVIENETPFLNLFYTKFATDYLFLHQLHEALKPGSLQNMEQHYKDLGKGFFVPPSEVIDYGGKGTPGQGIAALPKLPGAVAESVKPQ